MLFNSMSAAGIATTYVLALFLHLNPHLPLHPARLTTIVATVGLYYVVHLTVIFYVLLAVWQLLGREVFSPAWTSVGVLTVLCGTASAAGAVLMWNNAEAFARVTDRATSLALERSAVVLAASAILFALVGVTRRAAPRARGLWATMFLIVAGASAAAPLALRGRGAPPFLEARPIDAAFASARSEPSPRVTVIAIDAASLDLITRATAEGRLPNFGRILDAGAVRHLATLHPTSAEAVWAAVATGKLPQKNGIRSAAVYQIAGGDDALQLLPVDCFAHGLQRFGFLIEHPHTSAAFRTRTLWSIASVNGFSVGVVGWPLTQPAPPVRGYLVADTYHRSANTALGIDEPSALYPPDLQDEALAAMEVATADAPAVVNASLDGAPAGRADARESAARRTDRIYDTIAQAMARRRPAQLTLTRYQSLDPIGHYYLRYALPSEFGDVTDEERRRLGAVLERHYAWIDDAIGRAMAALGQGDLLVVVSAYGMEPLAFGKRVIERVIGDPDLSGTHEDAPDGFLLAYGASVARGREQTPASVVDVTPTILYFLGLPIGRDMDGYARTDLFQRSFTEPRPITFIPTHDR